MDRRSFVIGRGLPPAAAGPAFRTRTPTPRMPITIINAFPAGRRVNDLVNGGRWRRRWKPILKQPVVGRGPRARRRRPRSAPRSAPAPSPTATPLLSHNTGISGYAEVDKLFDRPAQGPPARRFSLHWRAWWPTPVVLLVNDQQPYKTLKDFVDDARQRPNTVL